MTADDLVADLALLLRDFQGREYSDAITRSTRPRRASASPSSSPATSSRRNPFSRDTGTNSPPAFSTLKLPNDSPVSPSFSNAPRAAASIAPTSRAAANGPASSRSARTSPAVPTATTRPSSILNSTATSCRARYSPAFGRSCW